MTFDDWWEKHNAKFDGPLWGTSKEIARRSYMQGQADTLETIDPDNFDPLLFIPPPPAAYAIHPPAGRPEGWVGG